MKEKSFEENLKRIEEIIDLLGENKLSLKESTAAFEEAMQLLALCEKELDETEKIVSDATHKSNDN